MLCCRAIRIGEVTGDTAFAMIPTVQVALDAAPMVARYGYSNINSLLSLGVEEAVAQLLTLLAAGVGVMAALAAGAVVAEHRSLAARQA